MLTWLAIVAAAVAIASAAAAVVSEGRKSRDQATAVALFGVFAPAAREARDDPRRLLAWQPAVAVARRQFPEAMRRLDGATAASFPFSADDAREAHAQWTASWLAWERAHDEEYKLKAVAAEAAIGRGEPDARARLAAVEREKLERYQQRYEEYVRVGKGLAALFAEGERQGVRP